MKINRDFLKKHRSTIIAVCVAAAVFAAAFIYDGAPSDTDTETTIQYTSESTAEPTADMEIEASAEPTAETEITAELDPDTDAETSTDTIPETAITEENRPENAGSGKMTAEEKTQLAAEFEASLSAPTYAPAYTSAPTPAPTVTPAEDNEGIHYCTISVRCDTILTHMAWLDEAKRVLIPSDGVIYENTAAEFSEGESVFDVLLRELRANNIHFEYENTAVYQSAYIEGIANIYEYDCGELSGWMYSVNGEFPGFASSEYILSDGDVAEIVYTCDLGRDVGAYRTGGAANE